ncbi:MAG: superoxide dismutase family protein [Terricaulis sp.]
MRRLAAFLLAALFGGCASAGGDREFNPPPPPRSAWVVGPDGRALGQARFTEGPAGVLIRLEFSGRGMPSGWHGVHLHQRGDCSDFAAGFQASGGHLGMAGGAQHGLMNPFGPEPGDLPSLFAAPSGVFGAELFNPRVTLRSEPVGERIPLLDADGSALVIHAAVDDQTSQPIGGAGVRIACAALTQLP